MNFPLQFGQFLYTHIICFEFKCTSVIEFYDLFFIISCIQNHLVIRNKNKNKLSPCFLCEIHGLLHCFDINLYVFVWKNCLVEANSIGILYFYKFQQKNSCDLFFEIFWKINMHFLTWTHGTNQQNLVIYTAMVAI